ncbi:MAG: hypothetical protein IPP52_00905 [Ignavibacteria bacterium]|nr:hypothetical protein [Ignavibacteria bacterium]
MIPKKYFLQLIALLIFITNINSEVGFSFSNQSVNSSGISNINETSGITAVITYYQLPRTLQFFARDNQDSASVTFSGKLYTSGYDSVFAEVYRNNVYHKRKSVKLNYSGGVSSFTFSQKIHSELSEYKFKLYLKSGGSNSHIYTADSVVCGDAFIICGQSNSHPTDVQATYKNEFCRSFGVQTSNYNSTAYNPADTNWGYSKADGSVYYWSGPNNVGVWGLQLQRLIKETYGIPTCIINGGRASTTIEMHLRNDVDQTDLNSIYGKLLYRVNKSGLAGNIKAVFWYQGESDGGLSWMNYYNNFSDLYYSWKENYPGFKKIFLFQTRPCCSEPYASQLREVQRCLPKAYPDIRLMSTAGFPNYDGCHYSYNGYINLTDYVLNLVEKDLYNSSDTTDILPPDIKAAWFSNAQKNEIFLLFNNSKISYWPADTLGQSMKDYFYLDGATGVVSSGSVSGDTLKLRLYSSSNATKITYLPTVWTHVDSLVYEGPFLRNPKKIGALSFHNFPVSAYSPSTVNVTMAIEGYFNTVTNKHYGKDTVKIYLRNNYYPYLKRDSSAAVIDSNTLSGKFTFGNAPSGTYFLALTGKSLIETWSRNPGVTITNGAVTNFNFTTSASQAYGNNMILKGSKYCIYSSDINQDGIVDCMDNAIVSNFAYELYEGYSSADLNGDRIVDADDVIIAERNSYIYITKITP